jgi:hypothetical protein
MPRKINADYVFFSFGSSALPFPASGPYASNKIPACLQHMNPRHFPPESRHEEWITVIMPFRLEAAAWSASLPGRVKVILIARPLVAHPVKG